MTAVVKHSIPFRLGRALGTLARFCMHDRNPKVRWVKRVIFVGPLLFLVVSHVGWILSTILTVISFVAGIYAFSKIESHEIDFFENDTQAPYGRDVFGAPLNFWGKREDGLDLEEN